MLTPLPAVQVMRLLDLEPDPWQIEVLESSHPRMLLNCCRQAGKSTTVAILGLTAALYVKNTRVLLLSRSHRQSHELFRTLMSFWKRFELPPPRKKTEDEVEFANGSRIVSLPCREDTIRGFANVSLLIIDEAARVPDDIYGAVNPMLAVSKGRLIALSTPCGKRGFFYNAWARGGATWQRIEIPAERIPRIGAEFLECQRVELGESWYRQEYCCSFESLEGLVYPDFARCVVAAGAAPAGKLVGGIDFGFRNPFAALWGVLDRDGVLWLTGEHYARQKPLSYHAQRLPKAARWYADPAGASDIAELQYAGFKVSAGDNTLRTGIAAVTARLEAGTLKVLPRACPNLLAEAELYRYDDPLDRQDGCTEIPVDSDNHALAALRYLISMLDQHKMARQPGKPREAASTESEPARPKKPWLSADNDALFEKRYFPRDPLTGELMWPPEWFPWRIGR
ncbi:MAG TPA: terminase family protein [Gemmataceae bacterium]|nr:terminase family protein [Gemmataceae bacterium]